MKALILAAAIAALSSAASAGAAREPHRQADTPQVATMTEAGRLSSASLASLRDGSSWTDAGRSGAEGANFSDMATDLEPGHLFVALCVLGVALSRPVGRLLRRQEQQRRATALASTLGHPPRG